MDRTNDTPSTTPAALKQRRYRARKREGARPARTDLPADVIKELVKRGWLSLEEATDPAALGAVLADLADCYCDGRLDPPATKSVTP